MLRTVAAVPEKLYNHTIEYAYTYSNIWFDFLEIAQYHFSRKGESITGSQELHNMLGLLS